jgi:hypothetical protein
MHLGPAGTDPAGAGAWGRHGTGELAGLVCYRSGQRSRLIYRARPYRGRRGESTTLTWTDYRDLLVAACQELDAPIVLVWDKMVQYQASLMDGCLTQTGLIMQPP